MTTLPVPYWRSDCGRHTLYHGDCLAILPHLSGVDAVVTDPPYGIGDRMSGGTRGLAKKYADFRAWDVAPDSEMILRLCDGRNSVVWGGNYFGLPPSRCWLAWDKQNAVRTMADIELAWTNLDRPAKRKSLPVATHHYGHPTEKPIALMLWCLGFVEGATVLDPFAGSGTTGVACAMTGRRFIGIELDEKYCAIAKRRIEEAANHLFVPTETNPPDDDPPLFDPATEAA